MITFDDVKAILAKQLRRDPGTITMDAEIKKDLGADSLDILQLLMRVEDDFGIVIPDQELAGFKKVSDIMAFLEKQQNQ